MNHINKSLPKENILTPTNEQKANLIAMATEGDPKQAIERCIQICHDNLASQLFERGGFATLQLNANPLALPRMEFVAPDETYPINSLKVDGVRLVRD